MKRKQIMKKLTAVILAGVMCTGTPGLRIVFGADGTETELESGSGAGEAEAVTEAGSAGEDGGIGQTKSAGIQYAKQFNIEYLENGVKLLTDGDGNKRLLVPKETEIPEGYEDMMVIRTPVEHVVYDSTTQIGMLKELGGGSLYDTIAAVSTPASDWTIPEIVEKLENGGITYLEQGEQGVLNIEEIAGLAPDLVVLSAGEPALQLGPQLEEFSIPYVVDYDWAEESDEALMEWMKFFAAFYNEDQKAQEVLDANIARIDELRAQMAEIPEESRPVVAYGSIYSGVVYTVPGGSRTAQTIEAAGGTYALADLEGEGSVQLGMEEFLEKARDADIIVMSSMILYTPDKQDLLENADYGDPLMAEFKAFQEDQIFVYGKDYYMASAAVVEKFEDWVAMLHPEQMEGYELKHFVRLPDVAE